MYETQNACKKKLIILKDSMSYYFILPYWYKVIQPQFRIFFSIFLFLACDLIFSWMMSNLLYIELLKRGYVRFCLSDFLLLLSVFCFVFKCILFVHVDESAKWRKNAIKYFTFEGFNCSDIISFPFFLKIKRKWKKKSFAFVKIIALV